MFFFISLTLLAAHVASGHGPSIMRKEPTELVPSELVRAYHSEAHNKSFHRTGEHERATYLEGHKHMVAVVPGVISRGDAMKLHEAVDRRWRHVEMSRVRQLQADGGDGDNLVEATDVKPSYSADIIEDGRCMAGNTDEHEFIIKEDCVLAQDLLKKHVTPVMEQKMKEWKLHQDGQEWSGTLQACDSFVKRYMPGERTNLHAHRDVTSLLTANVLLSDPGDFQGGLIMFPEADKLNTETPNEEAGYLDESDVGDVVFLEHAPSVAIGELVLHRGSTWHGVRMLQPKTSRRYTWITWYSPIEKNCSDRNYKGV